MVFDVRRLYRGIEWEMLPLYRPDEDKGEQWRKVTPLVNPKMY
jgi:hypothetical protein